METPQVGLESLFPEIFYEYMLPYLSSSDISALREVNKYFKMVFEADQCWRKFVHYPWKYYLCDRRSYSNIQNQNVASQNHQQQKHNWHEYYNLQEQHLHSWSRETISYDSIRLPLNSMSYMEELVSEFYDQEKNEKSAEHLVCFSVGVNIHIWDITIRPLCLAVVNVGQHALIRLLPHKKFLVKGEEGCILALYKLLPKMNSAQMHGQLIFLFRFDEEIPRPGRDLSGNVHGSFHFRFILMTHIFIGFIRQLPVTEDSILHFWDLKEDRKLFSVNSAQNIHVFERFIRLQLENKKRHFDVRHWNLSMYEGESACVIVVFKCICSSMRFSQISICDIRVKNFTHVITQTNSEVVACSMYRNNIFVAQKMPYLLNIFSVPHMKVNQKEIENDRLVLNQGQCLYEFKYDDSATDVVLKSSKLFIRTDTEVVIISTLESLCTIRVLMDAGYKILGFFEPKLLLMYNIFQEPTSTEVRVYDIYSAGNEIIRSWKNVNIESSRFKHYFTNLVYPSKLILNIGRKDEIVVFKF